MLAVSSIDAANLVYEIFKGKLNPQTNEYMYAKYPEVNVVADFSTTDNELLTDPSNDLFVAKCDKNAFKKRVIRDFASLTGELVNDDDQSMFSQLLIEHLRTDPRDEKNPIRIVIVVDKLLTGFDSDYVNTLFLDKPLKSFRLIQAISRTTRVCSESKKTTGFLLSYRTNKEDIEKAFGDYSGNKEHSITLLDTVANYKKRMEQIKNEVNEIRAIFSTPNDIDKLDQLDEIIKRNKTHEFRTHFKTLKGLIEIFIKYDNHK
jgi:type I restriction enzyme R subunit